MKSIHIFYAKIICMIVPCLQSYILWLDNLHRELVFTFNHVEKKKQFLFNYWFKKRNLMCITMLFFILNYERLSLLQRVLHNKTLLSLLGSKKKMQNDIHASWKVSTITNIRWYSYSLKGWFKISNTLTQRRFEMKLAFISAFSRFFITGIIVYALATHSRTILVVKSVFTN